MTAYLVVKWLHILSATILFGTGIGTALHMWLTHLGGDPRAIASTARNVVRVDWVFTVTSGVVQPVTGIVLVMMRGFDPMSPWLLWTYLLYALAFACWARVVWLQIRVRDIAETAVASGEPLPESYFRHMRQWFWLGWPAFISLVVVFWLMVAKPA
ncbi:MAG: DUF2269 domain-containing protein [Burkholderiales bacterium]|nr:DUF2269 domain-containing protein [Burkholderiales bacterium]